MAAPMGDSKEMRELKEEIERMRLADKESQSRIRSTESRLQSTELRLQENTSQLQPTTLLELHQECHLYFERFMVEPIKARRTKGTTTNPTLKPCPLLLREWTDFSAQRQSAFDQLLEVLPKDSDPQSRMFPNQERLRGIGESIPEVPIGSEESTKVFLVVAVENVLRIITNTIAKQHSECRKKFGLKDQLVFTDHSNPLQDNNEEVLDRMKQKSADQKVPSSMKADRLCYTIDKAEAEDERQPILVVELKAPHKFSQTILQRGLQPMNVRDDVVNKQTDSSGDKDLGQCQAEKLVAAGLAQTYTYMLQTGLEYGCLKTGESIVFLRVDKAASNTLFYHLAIPQLDVKQFQDQDQYTPFPSALTAVGQMLSFVLMALQSPPRDQDWRDKALTGAYKWEIDESEIYLSMSSEVVKPGIESPEFKSKASLAFKRSPYPFRNSNPGCDDKPNNKTHGDDDNDDDDDDDNQQLHQLKQHNTPTPGPGKGKYRQTQRSTGTNRGGSSTNHQNRQYCTQLCLLGLVNGTKLDRCCPNVRTHRRGQKTGKHLLTQSRLCALIQKQLARSLVRGLTDLNLQGSRGRLFKITLLSHGYTFVAKGTRDVFIPDLYHEATIYQHLRALQGDSIPVFLGNIDLVKKWWDLGYCIIHMLLMSYGGESVDWICDHKTEHRTIVEKMQGMGVSHGDLAERNTLWDARMGKLMVVDFERSKIVSEVPREKVGGETVKTALGKTTGNVRAPRRRGLAKGKLAAVIEDVGEENKGRESGKRGEMDENDVGLMNA